MRKGAVSEPLWTTEHSPVAFSDRDLTELRRLAPALYAAHNITTAQVMNRYVLYVGDGLADIARFLSAQPTRKEQGR